MTKFSFYYIIKTVSYGEFVYFPFFSRKEALAFIKKKEGKLVKPNEYGYLEYNKELTYSIYSIEKWSYGDEIVEGGYSE